MESRIDGIPLDLQGHTRRIIREIIGYGANNHGIDLENLGKTESLGRPAQLDFVLNHGRFNHAHRHDFKTRYRLKLVKIGNRNFSAV